MTQAIAIHLQGDTAALTSINAQQTGFVPLYFATRHGVGPIRKFHPALVGGPNGNETLLFIERPADDKGTYQSISDLPRHIQNEIGKYRLYLQSIEYAAFAHGDQKYSTLKLPYLYHLMQTDKVVDAFFDEMPIGQIMDTKMAALLHDTLEDTAATAEEIEAKFGKDILRAVERVTKIDEKDTKDYEERYYRQVAESPMSAFVKIADKCANTKQTLKYFSEWHAKRI